MVMAKWKAMAQRKIRVLRHGKEAHRKGVLGTAAFMKVA